MGRKSKTVGGLRPCSKCKEIKPLESFSIHSTRNRPNAWCKKCHQAHSNKKRTSEQNRKYALKTKYGISDEYYMELFEIQSGGCAICKRKDLKLVVDHNHSTGQVRGLLCGFCNPMLGMAMDSEDILKSAIDYLSTPSFRAYTV